MVELPACGGVRVNDARLGGIRGGSVRSLQPQSKTRLAASRPATMVAFEFIPSSNSRIDIHPACQFKLSLYVTPKSELSRW